MPIGTNNWDVETLNRNKLENTFTSLGLSTLKNAMKKAKTTFLLADLCEKAGYDMRLQHRWGWWGFYNKFYNK